MPEPGAGAGRVLGPDHPLTALEAVELAALYRGLDTLVLWTVYDHPRDYPDAWVARPHVVGRGGSGPLRYVLTAPSLEAVRGLLPPDVMRLTREPGDDPAIAEVWL